METFRERKAIDIAASEGTRLTTEAFVAALHHALSEYYYDKHPFHHLMIEGHLKRAQIASWVVNHFYYQEMIPIKDAAILSNCPYPAVRRVWMQRLVCPDGAAEGQDGVEDWLQLAEAAGRSRQEVLSEFGVLPGVRFAIDAYVAFARTRTWIEAVAASLMERFTSDLKKKIIDAFYHHYEWVDPHCLTCLRRLGQAPHDTTSALVLVTQHCHTREQQERAIAAVEFKGEVLWSFLDAIHYYSCTRDS